MRTLVIIHYEIQVNPKVVGRVMGELASLAPINNVKSTHIGPLMQKLYTQMGLETPTAEVSFDLVISSTETDADWSRVKHYESIIKNVLKAAGA